MELTWMYFGALNGGYENIVGNGCSNVGRVL
jgi:hypothetical protein